jgi:hypothetical protein
MRVGLITWALFGVTISAPLATASNIVSNPGFELGLAGWTINVNNAWLINTRPHSGIRDIESPCAGGACLDPVSGAFFYQDLPTLVGQTYNLSFFAFFEGAPDEIKVTWGGVTALDILNPAVPDDVYAQYSTTNLLATSSTTRLEFFGRQDPNQSLGLVDIAVTTPEPSTLLLIGVALLIAAGLRWRHSMWSRIPAAVRSKYSLK